MISCGIDFGTSNSSIAINNAGKTQLINVEEKKVTIPSAMFFKHLDPDIYFGRVAIDKFLNGDGGRFMRSLKRVLGTSLMQQGTLINGKRVKFHDIIGGFIDNLKNKAENKIGSEIPHVVMGRPVNFVDNNDQANRNAQNELEQIAKHVGFKNIEFQFEPIAAAFAHEANISVEKLALIVDIGGGTSDFTVIRLSNEYLNKNDRTDDILANTGVRVGGNDLDKKLSLNSFMPEFGYGSTYGEKILKAPVKPYHELSEWSKVNFQYTQKIRMQIADILRRSHDQVRFGRLLKILEEETGHALLQAVESTKIDLTENMISRMQLPFVENELLINVERNNFEDSIEEDIEKMYQAAIECVKQANVSVENINLIVLTGGSTEIPFIQKGFRKMFKNAEISDQNRLSSVALGLAYDSMRRFN